MNTLFKKNRILQLIIVAIFVVASALSVPSSSIVSSEEVNEPGYVRTVFNMTNGLPTDEANAVLQTDDGYLWIGSYGGLLRYDGSTFRNFSAEGAIATPSISRLFEDSAGNLWIGSSDSGVFVYDGETFKAVLCTEKIRIFKHSRLRGIGRR